MHLKSALLLKLFQVLSLWKSTICTMYHQVQIDIYQVNLKQRVTGQKKQSQRCLFASPGMWGFLTQHTVHFHLPSKCRGTFDVHSWMRIRVAVCSDCSQVPTGLQLSLLDQHTGCSLVTHTRLNSHNFPSGTVTTLKTHESWHPACATQGVQIPLPSSQTCYCTLLASQPPMGAKNLPTTTAQRLDGGWCCRDSFGRSTRVRRRWGVTGRWGLSRGVGRRSQGRRVHLIV